MVLLGDACHPILPYLAQGATQAIEDAHELCIRIKKSFRTRDLEGQLRKYATNRAPRKKTSGEKLCQSLEDMGTTFIKLGQFLATRPDIIGEEIAKKVPDSVIETTPMPFQDSRNYRVSSDKLINESNFKPSFDLSVGIDEIYNLISEKRIKDVNDPRYSNQSFLQRYGVS